MRKSASRMLEQQMMSFGGGYSMLLLWNMSHFGEWRGKYLSCSLILLCALHRMGCDPLQVAFGMEEEIPITRRKWESGSIGCCVKEVGERYIFRNSLEESPGFFVQGKVVFKAGINMAENRGGGGRCRVEKGS